jgi:2-oxoacid:acceptor oxidoreductase gamma subunit (pyruvate/2-ketoisovalerate family)
MFEIRWHGRGGQGVVTAAKILGAAAMLDGKHSQSFPFFGAERRGAPVSAFTRIDERAIRLRSQIYNPNLVVVLDDSILSIVNPMGGLREDGSLIVNTRLTRAELPLAATVTAFDATALAQEHLGRPVVNTVLLGALSAVGLVSFSALAEAVSGVFSGSLGERNVNAARAAYDLVLRG